MTEDDARQFLIDGLGVSRETMERLNTYADLVSRENAVQNLVSPASLPQIWNRHIVDSAQLSAFAPPGGDWLDIGSGAGFPGLVVAMLRRTKTVMVEQRRLRVDFLNRVVAETGLAGRAFVVLGNIDTIPASPFAVISARAVTSLDKLFVSGSRFATEETHWVLPKGRSAASELEAAKASWQGDFRLEPSLTDPEARIVVATGVRRRRGR
ncbi:16S rRNA (guanine(527)-N(7))-methyltransferase RsmG [Allosphingosinicella indica]|uniref:Ribosomal RNA small subunit methyltransferase G n=1 Tax=Allosphingosinicella indica TaxID=941907 RepID=A0A1X7G4U6_9SPHN|nr:16S rRNA (guanine(527)-N(7))-methyltransferase RsmG [Allosphingosinicella indica]SMF63830.1 16S rRNA m(7)G-527 methyltransferase [Allosphingosinicella indica]